MPDRFHPLKVVSLLLQYPEAEAVEEVSALDLDEVGPASAAAREAAASWGERRRSCATDCALSWAAAEVASAAAATDAMIRFIWVSLG